MAAFVIIRALVVPCHRIDTPIVRDAQAFAREYTIDSIYYHVMRSWLLSALIINSNDTLRTSVALEVHAIASLLHDIGLDQNANSPIVSSDRRFEVDGAFAAKHFVQQHEIGQVWDMQLVSKGAVINFTGPVLPITKPDWDTIVAQFPRTDFGTNFNESIIHLCMNKPNTTYDNWMQSFGDRYVAGYSSKGHDLIDITIYP
ncbi:hypothetical protein V8C35DRAFT_324468 [Trichoderma chlorosporum]